MDLDAALELFSLAPCLAPEGLIGLLLDSLLLLEVPRSADVPDAPLERPRTFDSMMERSSGGARGRDQGLPGLRFYGNERLAMGESRTIGEDLSAGFLPDDDV